MLLTSGDIFFGAITGGAVAIFTGVGLLMSRPRVRRQEVGGVGLIAAGVLAVVAPMMGMVDTVMRII